MTRSAIIYARFSSTEQGKGFSLERQISNGRQFVQNAGWTLDDIIRDEGRSAYSGANRQAGSALHKFEAEAAAGVHRGKILCVENVDRLSRQGAKQSAQLIWSLNEYGVDVATWQDGLVYRAESDGDLMELFSIIIKAQMAHEESLKKAQRTKDSWTKRYAKMKDGDKRAIAARTPAWLDVSGNKYVLNAQRVRVLNEIFDWYIEGIGINRIVQLLNSRNESVWNKVAERKDGGWYPAYIHRLLTSRAVLGEYVTLKGDTIASDHYPQAVTAEKFSRAAGVRSTKRSTGGGDRTRINNLLSGMVKCASCGGSAGYENKGASRTTPYTRADGTISYHVRKEYERLRCDRNRRKRGCENSSLFDYKQVEAVVLDALAGAVFASRRNDPKLTQITSEIAEFSRKLLTKSDQIEKLIDSIADSGSKRIVSRIQALEAEVDNDARRLKTLRKIEAIYLALPEQADDVAEIARLRNELRSSDYDTRYKARSSTNQALRRLSVEVVLNADGSFLLRSDGIPETLYKGNSDGTMTSPASTAQRPPLLMQTDTFARLLAVLEGRRPPPTNTQR